MFKNYLKIAIRNIIRYKGFSFINILGLTIGLAVFSLIMVYVQYELSADKHNLNYDRIYRVDLDERFGVSSMTILREVLDKFPEVEAGTRYFPRFLDVGYEQNFFRTNVTFVDPEFVDIFTLEQIRGNLKDALKNPNSAIVSKAWAEKMFGDEDPIGKTICYDRALDFTIEAVYDAPRQRTQLHLQEVIAPIYNLKDYGLDFEDIWWANYITYFLLPPNRENTNLITGINEHFQQLHDDIDPNYPVYYLRKFSELYFDSDKFDYSLHGNRSSVTIFFTSAMFIIFLVAINFINLSTARASLRAKEIVIRKISGSNRKQLFLQFLIESLILSVVAIVLSLILTAFFYPQYCEFFRIVIPFFTLSRIIQLFGFGLLFGFISGVYPAVYLSGFMSVKALTGKVSQGIKGKTFRSILIVIQFTVSISLIICTFIIKDQLDYFRKKDLGFDKEHVINFKLNKQIREHRDAFRQTLLQNPNIIDVSYIYFPLGQIIVSGSYTDENDEMKKFRVIKTDPNFLNVHGIELLEGRNFDPGMETDIDNIIINEAMVKEHGIENPLEYQVWEDSQIIGVVKDFNYRALQYKIEPLMIWWESEDTHSIAIRINRENIQPAIEHIKNTFMEFCPDIEFDYNFNNELFNKHYQAEERFSLIFRYFSGLSIFIACLGLFGLVSFLTTNRTKEIGIRKVLGANVPVILRLLTKEITVLVLAANLIACPVSYLVMQKWMNNFANKADISIGNYLTAAFLVLCIAWLTVAYQTIQAALKNPVESLKYE
ncbi:MAG: ABC transporter permease [Candidatus Cloacimonetes bacterium]|nr:ABC transporter permease [Candidatus Cloacimonadota bacterium]